MPEVAIHHLSARRVRLTRALAAVIAAVGLPGLALGQLANGVNPTNMGKGDWTFYLSSAESNLGQGSVQALFNYEASQGVKFVVVKAQDGASTGQWGYSASVVTAAHNAGLKIFAYGYLYGNYYGSGGEAAELSTTLSIISSTSPDGFVIDAESEYNNQPTAASNYCAGFKASYPNLFLSYSPFVDISQWPNYPYIQFGQYCDAVMPQAYFEVGPGYSPSGMVSYMDSQWSTWQNGLAGTPYTNSIKPIVPICQAYNDQYFTDNASDLIDFVNDLKNDSTPATAGGYHGVSFFDADNETAQMRVEIAEASIGTGGENAAEVSQSVANNTTFLTGQGFSCTWVMTNNGAITWTNTDFSFNYTGGTQMGAASVTHASTNVPPGQTTSYTINFTAPTTPGTYTANFQMNDNYGYSFGQPVSLTVVISTGNSAVLGPMTVPSSVPVGQSFSATVNMTNSGVVSWTSSGNYHMGSQSPEDNTTWGFDRINLPSSPISPGQGAVFSFTPTAPSTPGTYAFAWSMVQDGVQWFGPTNSKNITVFIPLPAIVAQPQNETVNLGGTATFSVTVSNVGGPFFYQWALGGTNIVGANSNVLTLANVTALDAGTYSVTVTNKAGATTSSNALLTVVLPPFITAQPQNETVTEGTAASFSVSAGGTLPLNYQWSWNGAPISGANGSSYVISSAQLSNAGPYAVTISNSAGVVSSANAVLTVTTTNVAPYIATQPANQTVVAGSTAVFSVVAGGTSPLSYQWSEGSSNLVDGGGIFGSQTPTLTISNVSAANAGNYSILVTNTVGSAASQSAALVVHSTPVLAPIPNQTVNELTLLSFTATASDPYGFGLQFSLNPGAPSGATINPATGLFTWAAATSQAPSTNSVTVHVSDYNTPPASAAQTFTIVVQTVSAPPTLFVPGEPQIPWHVIAAGGASSNGLWLVTGAVGQSDAGVMANGNWQVQGGFFSAGEVGASGTSPEPALTVAAQTTLEVPITAVDPYVPLGSLIYSLLSGPDGMTINANTGVITWTPTAAQAPGLYTVTVQVSDGGTPPLTSVRSFTVEVTGQPLAPVLAIPSISGSGAVTLTWNAVPGQTYRVQYASNLNAAAWTPLTPDVTATTNAASLTDYGSAAQRFYRVLLLP